jgi:hypothetical protein
MVFALLSRILHVFLDESDSKKTAVRSHAHRDGEFEVTQSRPR